MTTLAPSAVELYRLITGEDLSERQAQVLERMLSTDDAGRWVARVAEADNRRVLEARALAGMFLFGEDLIWSFYRSRQLAETFERIALLVDQPDMLGSQVGRVRRANGAQSIQLTSGRRLTFRLRSVGGLRGISADCHLLDEAMGERHDTRAEVHAVAMHSCAGRPNPQLVIYW